MKTLFIVFGLGFALSAGASYREGTFHCKSSGGENVYSVRTVNVGGVDLPYVEAVLHYHKDISDPHSPVQESIVRGFAADSSTGRATTLMLAALHLEFEDGALLNCKE